jgi:hypothetical protein
LRKAGKKDYDFACSSIFDPRPDFLCGRKDKGVLFKNLKDKCRPFLAAFFIAHFFSTARH